MKTLTFSEILNPRPFGLITCSIRIPFPMVYSKMCALCIIIGRAIILSSIFAHTARHIIFILKYKIFFFSTILFYLLKIYSTFITQQRYTLSCLHLVAYANVLYMHLGGGGYMCM